MHDVDVITLTLALVLSFELGMAKAVTTEIATATSWAALLTVAIAIRSFRHVALLLDHSGRSHHLSFYQALRILVFCSFFTVGVEWHGNTYY